MSGPAIGVIGAGAWGTALAQAMASDGSQVLIWAREAELVAEINTAHTNGLFLPSARLADQVRATGDLADLAELPVLLVVTPAQHLARVLSGLPDGQRDLVLCSKGIEAGTGRLMADVAAEAAPAASLAVLSGPTFAHEVAAGLPVTHHVADVVDVAALVAVRSGAHGADHHHPPIAEREEIRA
ncbi:MAG TPA: NAD(P)-binding domain-containing protein, partial [Novosphingobium sp.]|nr:NAD(P)-binding domain-containing protein [Novosphingobium sp.]